MEVAGRVAKKGSLRTAGTERDASCQAQRSRAQSGREGTRTNQLGSGRDCFYKCSQPFSPLYIHAHAQSHVCQAMPSELVASVLHERLLGKASHL